MRKGRHGPVYRMLAGAAGRKALRFHTPGHKGRIRLPFAAFDLTELPGTDALHEPSGALLEAAAEAASCWRAGQSFLLVNGSTAGIQAMTLWAAMERRKIVLPRDCHVSAIYACAIAGMQPVWLDPVWSGADQLSRFSLDCLDRLPDSKFALFLTYPDYYGRCIGLDAVKTRLAGHDGVILADSAHGAHFAFSDLLPPDAGSVADAWVTGAHKTLPAPTQTALLHVKDPGNGPAIARFLRSVTTTSPSFPLLAGLDDSRLLMQRSGSALDSLVESCDNLAARLNRLPGLRCWREEDALSMGYGGFDPTRLVVDVRGLGLNGWQAGERLRALGVEPELCDIYRVVLIATVMDDEPMLNQLVWAFEQLAAERQDHPFFGGIAGVPARGEAVMTIREAWFSKAVQVPVEQAAGRIAAEPFGAYPPGIALCAPGEVITADAIALARQAQALGGGLFGVRQGALAVVAQS